MRDSISSKNEPGYAIIYQDMKQHYHGGGKTNAEPEFAVSTCVKRVLKTSFGWHEYVPNVPEVFPKWSSSISEPIDGYFRTCRY